MITIQEYIIHKGCSKVAKELGVEVMTVLNWKNYKSVPKPETASRLVAMTNKVLTWESIYQPYVDFHANKPKQEIIDPRIDYTEIN